MSRVSQGQAGWPDFRGLYSYPRQYSDTRSHQT